MDIERTVLPGKGIKYTFVTQLGRRVGLVCLHNGQRELILYDEEHPQVVTASALLESAYWQQLAELLHANSTSGGSCVDSTAAVDGTARIAVRPGSVAVGRDVNSLESAQLSIVAVVRDGELCTNVEGLRINAGDTIVTVGGYDAISAFNACVDNED